jgi:predicted transposase YbfD/YdcC
MEPLEADFPFARSLTVVRSERTEKKTGQTSNETRYYLSSIEPSERSPAQWQALVRGHWGGVEMKNHWRRDVVWGEDRSRTRNPNALANLAVIRNGLLALLPEHFPDQSLPVLHDQFESSPATGLRLLRAK